MENSLKTLFYVALPLPTLSPQHLAVASCLDSL